jgi:hypothetical protein
MKDESITNVTERTTLKKYKAHPDGTADKSDGPIEEMVYDGDRLVKHVKTIRVAEGLKEIDVLDKEKANGTH